MTQGWFFRNRAAATVSLAVVVCAIVGALGATRFFRGMELSGFDLLVAASDQPEPAPQVAFVDISDATVAAVKKWPIPRAMVAQGIRRIAEGSPELIGADILFSEARSPEEDQAVREALAEAGNVVLASNRNSEGILFDPLPEFREAAFDVALVDLHLDEDGAIRRAPLALVTPDVRRVGFAALLASNFLGQPLKPAGPGAYSLGGTRLPTRHESGDVPSVLLGRWRAPSVHVDLLKLLDPAFDPSVLKGKIVIFGTSSEAGKDRFETPLYSQRGLVSGPEIHAAAVAALLDGRVTDVVAGWRPWAVNLLLALLALGLVMHGRPAWSVPAVLAVGGLLFLVALRLLGRHDLWLPWVSGELTLALSLPVALGYRYLRESRMERRMRELFGRYVSRDVLQEILRHPEEVALEGRERTASVLFTDIRGFTATSAGAEPREVIAWLNEYFAAMSEVIDRHGGFLNKFIGDGLMVVFGAPVSEGEQRDAERAVATALDMVKRLEGLDAEYERRRQAGAWRPPIRIGLGIHTGKVAAGNVGSPARLEYSVIGETVNLAARLESSTRKFDVDLVISPATAKLVEGRFETVPLGRAEAKGFAETVEVFTVREKKRAPERSAS